MTSLLRARLASRRDDSGATSVEFSVLLPIALLFIGFTCALGLRMIWAGLTDDAARSLARYSSIRLATGYYPSRPALVTKSGQLLGGILGTPTINMTQSQFANVTYDQDAATTTNSGPGDLVTVQVTYSVPGISFFSDLVKNLPLIGVDLSGFSTVTETSTARRE